MKTDVYAEEIVNLLTKINELEACKREMESYTLQLIQEKYGWQFAFQQCTPGGPEFQTPEDCLVYVQVRREEEQARYKKEREALLKIVVQAIDLLENWEVHHDSRFLRPIVETRAFLRAQESHE